MFPASRSLARPRAIMLVADDFGLTAGISRGILDLVAAGRLTGTGAMVGRPHWRPFARRLAELGDVADVGLHLTLTLGNPLGRMRHLCPGGEFPPLPSLMRAAFTGRLDRAEIEAEILAQIDAFAQAFGRLPDYVDGHQHVHVLPGIRGALLSAIARRWGETRPWIRDPGDSAGAIVARGLFVGKALGIAGLAALWGRRLAALGLPANRGFAGITDFDPRRDYAADLARWVSVPGPCHLVMCHPGLSDDELAGLDPVVDSRPVEYACLAGSQLQDILQDASLQLWRYSAFQNSEKPQA